MISYNFRAGRLLVSVLSPRTWNGPRLIRRRLAINNCLPPIASARTGTRVKLLSPPTVLINDDRKEPHLQYVIGFPI